MAPAAIIFNVALVALTCLVLATDGAPREVLYVVFGILLLAVPVLSAAVLVGRRLHLRDRAADASPRMRRASQIGVLCNVLLLGTACWALYDQYPHPDERGFSEYVVVILLTPILSIVALLSGGKAGVARDLENASRTPR